MSPRPGPLPARRRGRPRAGSALIVAAGTGDDTSTGLARIDPDGYDLVGAADGGLDHLLARGLDVDLVVGDLDSVSADGLERARSRRVTILSHPRDKDETDLELALAAAVDAGVAGVTVVLDGAGRIDHAFANLAVLASPRWAGVTVDAVVGDHDVHVVRGHRTIGVDPGGLVSVLPVGGPARGLSSRGLRWRLDDDRLEPWAGRGLSNVAEASRVELAVGAGVVLVIVTPAPGSAH